MSLQSLYLMPTLDCNCRCSYCYIPEKERRKVSAAPDYTAVLQEFLSQTEDNPQLRFIGGEPLLYRDSVTELIRNFLNSRTDGFAFINTNGTLVQNGWLESLHPFVEKTGFIISLDGPEELHNSRRKLLDGKNGFREAVRAIRMIQECGFPVLCNMVLDPQSAEFLPDFFAFLKKELQMNAVSISLNSNYGGSFPLERKIDLLLFSYREGEKSGLTVSGHHRLLLGGRIPELRCRAGENTLLITPDQRAWSCQRFVGKASARIWSDAESLKRAADSGPVQECCYTAETARIAAGLYDFYSREANEYLHVNDTDRFLFGVI